MSAPETKERPILFKALMVCAILDGRKTQTRRPIKPQWPDARKCWISETGLLSGESLIQTDELKKGSTVVDRYTSTIRCPFGEPGDRLWVRETWGPRAGFYEIEICETRTRELDVQPCLYRATDEHPTDSPGTDWRASIHMPRWASRILLEVTAVRVERIQDITEEDAKAEGVERMAWLTCMSYRTGLAEGWSEIYESKGYGWDANPWVWVVEFKVVTR